MAFVLSPDITIAEGAEGVVLMDPVSGRYWRLNHVGAATLRLLLDGYSPEAVAARIARDFPEASERAQTDVLTLLHALQSAHLLEAR